MFWNDMMTVVDLLPIDGPFDPVATTVLEVATRLVASAPPVINQGGQPHPVVGTLLSRRAPGWEELAVANVLDARWRDAILLWLPEVTPALLDRLASVHEPVGISMRCQIVDRLPSEKNPAIRARAPDFLKDEDADVRAVAIGATLAIMPERALDLILPLAKDERSGVRYKLAEALSSVFDHRSIPVLIELLQDPTPGVRDVATRSLDSIQYVFEQLQ